MRPIGPFLACCFLCLWLPLTPLFLSAPLVASESEATSQQPRTVAVFPVELWDTSGEGRKPGQAERLELATRTLARLLESTGRYRPIDLSPYADRVAATEPRYNCNGCWQEIAKDAGAQIAVLAAVHKVSTLISSLDIIVVELATGRSIAAAQGQFRGDDDRAYVRAFEFLVKNRLFADGPAP
jgi:hypothetical protein